MLIQNCKSFAILMLTIIVVSSCNRDDISLPVNNTPIPRILELVPENAGPGDLLTIKGINFSSNPDDNIVRFNQTVVEIQSANDSVIYVVVPEITTKVAGITVRSNGKISNKRNLNLTQVKKFTDNFNRPDQGSVDGSVIPNPIGDHWEIVMGSFELEDEKLATHVGGVQAYMLYRAPEAEMNAGDGNFFKLSADITVSGGSFGGLIFNAQDDGKRFYLLRMNGNTLQLLKTGNNGLDDWAAIMINQTFEGLAQDTPYRIEVSSSTSGQIVLKITNINSNGLVLDQTVEDANAYTGGVAGFYYFGLANPVNIYYDNLNLELQ